MNVLKLHPENGGPTVTLEQDLVRVGREPGSDLHLRDASVSRTHAEIERRGDDWYILDLESSNGVRLDSVPTAEALLRPGQRLEIGIFRFRVEIDRGSEGATIVLGRSPLLDGGTDRTLLAGDRTLVAGEAKGPDGTRVSGRDRGGSAMWLWAGVLALASAAGGFWLLRSKPVETASLPTPMPTVAVATTPPPTPEPTPTATATPARPRRPTGSLLVSSDIACAISIDGRSAGRIGASGLRRFDLAPGEHIVRFLLPDSESEAVVRLRVNEQTVLRRADAVASPPAEPAPTPGP